jgi:hypothetical protein
MVANTETSAPCQGYGDHQTAFCPYCRQCGVTSINVFLADDAPLGDAEPLASAITGVMETHLLTNNLIFFTPAERDLVQGLRAECKPGRFDAVPPKGVFEMPECPGAMDIPSGAIQRNGTRAFVFTVDKNTVSVRNITERSTDGVTTAVEGLQVGEMVALSSFDKLQEGTPVRVEPSPQGTSVNTGVQP